MVAIIKPLQDLWYSENKKENGTIQTLSKEKINKQKDMLHFLVFGKPV